MTFYEFLTPIEIENVEKTMRDLLKSDKVDYIFNNKLLIKIYKRRTDVYLIQKKDQELLRQIRRDLITKENILMHARIKLGFLVHEKFLIGIESLSFLSPIVNKKVYLNKQQTEKFIYGKDIDITDDSLYDQIKIVEDNSMVMVFSSDKIPLGYAKIQSKEKNAWLQNLVDIGIYLRSEKSAF